VRGFATFFALFAASVLIAGAAPVEDQTASFYQQMLTYSTPRTPLEINAEPELTFGPSLQFDGLLVDCIMPQETWNMLDPSVPVLNAQTPVPPSLLPVLPARPLSNPAVHEANFAVLRLSFP
jgi:hypothetical protein